MHARIVETYASPVGRVHDYTCLCGAHDAPRREITPRPALSFVRRGGFRYRTGRRLHDVHGGVMLAEGAGHEFRISHYPGVHDRCTIVEFNRALVDAAASDGRSALFAADTGTVMRVTPALAWLHHRLVTLTAAPSRTTRLETDALLIEMWREAERARTGTPVPAASASAPRPDHLESVDTARDYILAHYADDLSVAEVARHACVSPFHFSRLFRDATGQSPHRFLVDVRLARAESLLRDTERSVTDICFSTGFNSLEHFITAFRHRYGASPARHRRATPRHSSRIS